VPAALAWRWGLWDHDTPGGKRLVTDERASAIPVVVEAGRPTRRMLEQ